MRYWWVNHKQTFRQEFDGKYIWCPKRKSDGGVHHFYETVREVKHGDLIFSFAFGAIQGFGFAKTFCYSCPKPDEFGGVGQNWDKRGWRVDVGFRRFPEPLSTQAHQQWLAPLLPGRYSPIRENGYGNQGAYFSEISEALALQIASLASQELLLTLQNHVAAEEPAPAEEKEVTSLLQWEDLVQQEIENKHGLDNTQRQALILARRGQGLFKQRVSSYEKFCRITRVDNPTHLIASHIKPWRESSDDERLSAGNGLLLTPSIDHLFDRGFISFDDNGEVLISPVSDNVSLQKMGVRTDFPFSVGRFNSDQKHFLDYHRREIFLKSCE
jgi:putative restriction endonuclease